MRSKQPVKTPSTPARRQKRAERRRQGRLTSVLLTLGGLLLLVGVVFAFGKGQFASEVRLAVIGQPMSDITLTDLNGQAVRMSDFAGRPVLINAWATWCPPCKAEMPALQALYQAYQADGFTILAINGGESQATISRFIDQQGFTFPVLLDPNSATLQRLGINSFPTSIFVGTDGIIKTIHIGLLTPEAIQTELVPLLTQK